jgi:hypothetical protein
MRALGAIWLVLDAVVLLILLQPLLHDPNALNGPAAPEYIVPPLLIATALAIPGLIFLVAGLRKHAKGPPR